MTTTQALISEHTYRTEEAAHAARRELIRRGRRVSLIALDPSRGLFVFDLRAA